MRYKCVMRPFPAALVIAGALLASIGCAGATVVINVDKGSQKMSVEVDGEPRYEFAVSTGRAGYGTPNGTYHPPRLRHSRQLRDPPAGRTRLARLHPAAPIECRQAVRTGPAGGRRQHHHRG